MCADATNSSPGVVNAARKPHLALGLQRREAGLRKDSWRGPGMALSRCVRIPGLDDWKYYKSPGRDNDKRTKAHILSYVQFWFHVQLLCNQCVAMFSQLLCLTSVS